MKHTLRTNLDYGSTLVIYDGECDFCKAALAWFQLKRPIQALSFQSAPLEELGLSFEECSRQVVLLISAKKFLGADAIAQLLRLRGNKVLSSLITLSGPLGGFGYRWVASHRNSYVIRLWTRLLNRRVIHES